MKNLLLLIVALFVVSCTQVPPLTPNMSPFPENASVVIIKGKYNESGMLFQKAGCGAVAIGKHLLVTASHCVGEKGSKINYVTRDLWFKTTNGKESATVLEVNIINDTAYLQTEKEVPFYVSVRAPKEGETKFLVKRFEVIADNAPQIGVLEIQLDHGFSGVGVFGNDGKLLGVVTHCRSKDKVIINNNGKCSLLGGNYSPLF